MKKIKIILAGIFILGAVATVYFLKNNISTAKNISKLKQTVEVKELTEKEKKLKLNKTMEALKKANPDTVYSINTKEVYIDKLKEKEEIRNKFYVLNVFNESGADSDSCVLIDKNKDEIFRIYPNKDVFKLSLDNKIKYELGAPNRAEAKQKIKVSLNELLGKENTIKEEDVVKVVKKVIHQNPIYFRMSNMPEQDIVKDGIKYYFVQKVYKNRNGDALFFVNSMDGKVYFAGDYNGILDLGRPVE